MARKGNPDIEDIDTEYVAPPSTAPKLRGQRDTSLVEVLVLAHNAPIGVVLDPVLDEDGVPVLDDQGAPRAAIKERRLERKERVRMQKWCADIMAGNDHVVLL
jgi:hypothetical protein